MKKIKIISHLIWLDLEMSGLDPDSDKILEIATVITNNNLDIISQGPDLVINQSKKVLDNMGEWCTKQHGDTGLTQQVLDSNISTKEAEDRTLKFLKKHFSKKTGILCGNSIGQDKAFLYRYMPDLYNFLDYRIIDVSSIKELVKRWYPDNPKVVFRKKETHRALDDVYESIKELKHYRMNFFKKL